MKISIRNYLQNILLVATAGATVFLFSQFIQTISKRNKLRNAKIITLDKNQKYQDFKNKGNQIMLVKLHCKQSKKYKLSRPILSNQIIYNYYPILQNIQEYRTYTQFNQLKAQQLFNNRQISLQNFNILNDDIYVTKNQIKFADNSMLMRIIKNLGVIWFLFIDIFVQTLTLRYHRFGIDNISPIIGGIQQGTLQTTFQIVKNIPLIVQIQLQNERIVPKLMGLSIQDFISYYQAKSEKILFKIFIGATICYYLYKSIKRKAQQKAKEYNIKKHQNMILTLQKPIKDQNLCIICYQNNKNMIISQCNHLKICHICINSIKFCPLCRAIINDQCIPVISQQQKLF